MYPTTIHRPRHRRTTIPVRGDRLRGEAGASTVEVLSWAAMSVVAIVAIGGALQVLGLDIVDYVRAQLGV